MPCVNSYGCQNTSLSQGNTTSFHTMSQAIRRFVTSAVAHNMTLQNGAIQPAPVHWCHGQKNIRYKFIMSLACS